MSMYDVRRGLKKIETLAIFNTSYQYKQLVEKQMFLATITTDVYPLLLHI